MYFKSLYLVLSLQTPLHMAADAGELKTVGLLLDSGADSNLVDKQGRVSLHIHVYVNL